MVDLLARTSTSTEPHPPPPSHTSVTRYVEDVLELRVSTALLGKESKTILCYPLASEGAVRHGERGMSALYLLFMIHIYMYMDLHATLQKHYLRHSKQKRVSHVR